MHVMNVWNVFIVYMWIDYFDVFHPVCPFIFYLLSFCGEGLFDQFTAFLGLFNVRGVGNFIDITDYVFEFWF